MEVWFFVGIIALIIACGVYATYLERVRTRKLEELAKEMSLEFRRKASEVLSPLGGFQLFSKGRSRKVRNLLTGTTNEVTLMLFDYRYTTGSGKSRKTHRQTVCVFESPGLRLPRFWLRPESIFDSIVEFFGFADIDFADHPEFSRRYRLKGDHEDTIRELFDLDTLDVVCSVQKVNIEGDGERLVFCRPYRRVKPADVRGFLEEAFRVYGVMKRAE